MKIVIIAWRHWTAGRRYRSLALNAKRLGHEVVGFASFHLSDTEISIPAFQELGVPAYTEDQFHSRIDAINPDAVFGEWNSSTVPLEIWAQQWAAAHGRAGFLINHHLFNTNVFNAYDALWGSAHYLVTHQRQMDTALRRGWPEDQVHIFGCPDLDFVTEDIDVVAVREKLGVTPGQKLIGVFPTTGQSDAVMDLITLGEKHNWKIVVHLHPQTRRRQNWNDFSGGFYWTPARQGCWREPYNRGAIFIADYAPGNIAEIQFHRCQSFELMKAADCLLAHSPDVYFEAYALGKNCHTIRPWSHIPREAFLMATAAIVDLDFENQPTEQKILQVLEKGPDDVEHDPAFIEKWFFKLDGLWWQRVLGLTKELMQK